MSCSLTIDAVRARTKTVTRRAPTTWSTLREGTRLTLVEKAMGLPKGARQIVLADVVVVSVRVEPLLALLDEPDGIAAEGFDPRLWKPLAWCQWWAAEHGHRGLDVSGIECRRIQWEYA